MRRSTWVYLALWLLSAALLAWSVSRAGRSTHRDGKRVFRFACWGAAEEIAELRAKVIDPINASSDRYEIRVLPIPSDYPTKLKTMIAGGSPPDFFYLSQEAIASYAAQGALLDLTPVVESSSDPVLDLCDYYPGLLRPCRRDGRIWALPWIAQPVILYCNVDLFAQARVELPDENWTWEDFVRAGRKLTGDRDGDGRIDTWGFACNQWPPVEIWIWQNGGRLLDPRTGRLDLDDPRVREAMNFKADLIHKYRICPPLSQMGGAVDALFRAGRCAMFMGGAADDLDRLEGLNVSVRRLPRGPAGIRATFAWSAALAVSARVENRPLALEAWRRLLAGIQKWKIPAPRRSLAGDLERIEPRKARAADVIRRAMQHMHTPVGLVNYSQFDTLFWEEIEGPMLRTGLRAGQLAPRAADVLKEVLE
jgi:multiple sugar transport system substrate-binding protein